MPPSSPPPRPHSAQVAARQLATVAVQTAAFPRWLRCWRRFGEEAELNGPEETRLMDLALVVEVKKLTLKVCDTPGVCATLYLISTLACTVMMVRHV